MKLNRMSRNDWGEYVLLALTIALGAAAVFAVIIYMILQVNG